MADISKNIHRIIFMYYSIIISNQNLIYLLNIFKRTILHSYNSTMLLIQITYKINHGIALLFHYEFFLQKVTNSICSSSPWPTISSAKSVPNSTKKHQISGFSTPRQTRKQNTQLRYWGRTPWILHRAERPEFYCVQ